MTAQVVTRTVAIDMDDTMRFSPDTLRARAGETIRLAVRNQGKLVHELVIGTEAEIAAHAAAMRSGAAGHSHGGGASISLQPGQSGDLVVTFPQPADLRIACLEPGHYEAGMRGSLQVQTAAAVQVRTEPSHEGHTHSHR